MRHSVRVRRVSSGAVELAVHVSGPTDRPPIVLIHGYPDTHTLWDLVAARLADRFHVIAYDVRGAGASDAPDGLAGYDLERLAEDFAAVCDTVAPGRPVHLAGHDWGAIQGWEFATASRFAGRLASFTAVAGPALSHAARWESDPPGRPSPSRALRELPRLWRSWYVGPLCVPGLERLIWGGLIDRRRWERYLEAEGVQTDDAYPASTLIEDGRRGTSLYRRNIALASLGQADGREFGLPAGPRRAHVPVQIVIPARDRYIAPDYYAPAREFVDDLRLRTIPGSHWVPRTHPELLADLLSAFAHDVARSPRG